MVEKKVKKDEKDTLLNEILPHKFNLRDFLQIVIGASILAVPVGFTEEAWRLGESLPLLNVIGLLILSVIFMAAFVYYHYHSSYRIHGVNGRWDQFGKRVFWTYAGSFIIVAIILTLIDKTPWITDLTLAIKRVIIVTFPASMSAVIADTLK